MKIDIETIRKDTKTGLADDEDLSHLTEEIVEEARANAKPVSERAGEQEGNTFMRDGNNWKWRKNCSSNPADWLYWGGQASATRIVNCANNLLHYRIRWW
jgi:hypothetical protein